MTPSWAGGANRPEAVPLGGDFVARPLAAPAARAPVRPRVLDEHVVPTVRRRGSGADGLGGRRRDPGGDRGK